jgi:hypothetical protein
MLFDWYLKAPEVTDLFSKKRNGPHIVSLEATALSDNFA